MIKWCDTNEFVSLVSVKQESPCTFCCVCVENKAHDALFVDFDSCAVCCNLQLCVPRVDFLFAVIHNLCTGARVGVHGLNSSGYMKFFLISFNFLPFIFFFIGSNLHTEMLPICCVRVNAHIFFPFGFGCVEQLFEYIL